jgi:trans-4-hydroxy-L-proline dehydratase
MTSTPRITTLRSRCLERKTLIPPWDSDPVLVAHSLQASESEPSWIIRRGMLTRDLLQAACFAVDDLELLAGRLAPDTPEQKAARPDAIRWLNENYPGVFTPGQSGHCQLEFSRLFAMGLDGLAADLEQRRRQAQDTADAEKASTIRSFTLAVEGLSVMIEHAAVTAASAGAEAVGDPVRRAELEEIADTCRFIAHQPPETFHQALQLLWLVILGVQMADRAWLVSPGHIDRLLGPYYQADLKSGRITLETARLYIECLYLLINEYVPDGLAVAVMVGGRDASGQDLTNPLSYVCLQALENAHLVYPSVGVCWHPGTPADLTALAVNLMARGYANPAFFGDSTIQNGLQQYGVPAGEAWNYVNSTCVEITPAGSSNVWVASPYYSLPQILLDEIRAQAQSKAPVESLNDFIQCYQARLEEKVSTAVVEQNQARAARQAWGGKPLQSVFTNDCIERGQDIDRGGARYNWAECSFVGLANLADSLYVIQEEVFRQRHLSFQELQTMLDANFEGNERLRLRFLNSYPKYGNGIQAVDCLVEQIVGMARNACAQHHLEPDGSPYVPGAFCWVMHEQLGRECGATPDGRRMGFPFADGCGAAQGREKAGPTAAIRSVTAWDAAPLVGGAAFNMKFSASLFQTPGSAQRLQDLIITFLELGGFETQVNVVDGSVLRAAQAHPEQYRDLVVRIGGYTDYFTRLTPEMQAEVLLRTEYSTL